MTTFAVTNSNQLLPAVNYLLSNLDTGAGNVTLPGNVLVANTTTGVISQEGSATPFGYLYQYVNLRYSNNATGTAGFDTNSNNYSYFGVYNSATPTPSNNPAAYQWYEVSPPFSTASSRTLYYSAIGGRQIQWAAASAPPSTSYQVTVANVAIDLDVVTTATGTPGERGPIAMAFVITTGNPNTATASQLTAWFSASRENTVPPIGTGLSPVVGDTATFTWTAGAGQPSATLTYNGSIWIPVTAQVINGNVIINGTLSGNAITANTITSTQIATGTITANNIAANTITSNNIAANTITANRIATGTLTTNLFTANSINANILTANTFGASTISGQAIIANTFTANTINGQAIIANTFTANTINGNSIVSGTITADKLAANVVTANTVISTGATIGDFNSPGFWLQGNTGNARFGNTISIGNNLLVGNNAQIGGNLTVAGLINGGALNSNTVNTTTVVPLAISSGTGVSTDVSQVINNSALNTFYTSNLFLDFTTTEINQPLFVFAQQQTGVQFTTITGSIDVFFNISLFRQLTTGGPIIELFQQDYTVNNVTSQDGEALINAICNGISDIVPAIGTYRYSLRTSYNVTGTTSGARTLFFIGRTMLVQTLKR